MDKNSSTLNFKERFGRTLLHYRPVLLAAVLFVLVQSICLNVSDITQEGAKQVVQQKRIWARTPGKFKKQIGQQMVLVFGNSKTGAGFYPEVFDKINDHKTQSYNMALIALQMPPHYFLLKDFIKFNGPPDWILLQYSPAGFEVESFPSYSVQGAGFWEVLNYAYYRKNMDVLFNYMIPSRLHWPEVARYFVGKILRFMPQNLKDEHRKLYLNAPNANAIYGHNRKHFYESQYIDPEKYRKETLEGLQKNRGYYYISEQAAEGGVISKEYLIKVGAMKADQGGEKTPESDQIIGRINQVLSVDQQPLASEANDDQEKPFPPLVDDFFKLTQKYHIKVMIIPDYDLSPTGQEPQIFDKRVVIAPELKRLRKIYNNIYFPLEQKESLSFSFECFSDPGHVNFRGAVKYTSIIAREFKELTVH